METSQKSLPVTFRPMTPGDITRVHEIDMLSFSMPWTERSYRFEVTENQHSVVWVAEVTMPGATDNVNARRVVGMIVIWVIIDEAHIATIATHPDYRGLGIGRRLMARALLAAYERGARLAYLEVRRGNQVAQNLYNNFGFKIVGERPRYYQDNHEDALLMTLEELQPDRLGQFA